MKKQKQKEPLSSNPPVPVIALVPRPPVWVHYFVWGVFVLGGILLLWAMMQAGGSSQDAARLSAQGWGPHAARIVGNKVTALWHAAFMTLGAGGVLWFIAMSPWRATSRGRAAAWLLVAAMAGDALWLSRHYIKTMPLSVFDENEVVRLLKADMPLHRVVLLSQDGFYNFWLTYVFPYHHILSMNATQMPRMPVEYKRYMEAVGRQMLQYWQLSAVGYVLAPAQVWGQIQKDPTLKEAFDLAYAYNVAPAEMGVTVVPATPSAPGNHVVLRLKKDAPRFALIAGWEPASDEESLRRMGSLGFVPFQTTFVAPDDVKGLPALTGTGIVGQVELAQYRAGYMNLKVSSDRPAMLRVSEKYDRDWRAWIDNQPVPVRRVDFIFQGILIPTPGLHEVVLKYAPDKTQLIWQWLGILLCLGAGLGLILRNRTERQALRS